MIDVNNQSFNNAFTQFKLQNQPAQNTQKPANYNTPVPNQPIASVRLNNDRENSHTLTKVALAAAIPGIFIALLLGKGPSAKFAKKVNSWLQKLDNKIFDYTQRYNSLGTVQKWGLKFSKGVRKVLSPLKGLNNFTAIKDATFKWLTDFLHLKGIMNWITRQFKKITIKFSRKAYNNGRMVFDKNIAEFREAISIVQKKNPEAARTLEQYIDILEQDIMNFTSSTSRKQRLAIIERNTAGVGEAVSKDVKELLFHPTKETAKKFGIGYITEVHAAAGKTELVKLLEEQQRRFSFNITDKKQVMEDATNKIAQILDVNNTEARVVLRDISKNIKEYANLSGKTEAANRLTVVEKLRANIRQLNTSLSKGKYSNEEMGLIKTQIGEIESILSATEKKGVLEDILQILNMYVKPTDPKGYARMKALARETKKVVNNGFSSELKMYDKFAEYSVGSAPTDVFYGMLPPLVLAGYAITKGKDREEKVSATLKAGVPITGAVATSFICAAKMMTGIKCIGLGALAGFLVNRLGTYIDNKYKAYNQNQLFTQKAIAEFRKNHASTGLS